MGVTVNGRIICDRCGKFVKNDEAIQNYGFTVGTEPPIEMIHNYDCLAKGQYRDQR